MSDYKIIPGAVRVKNAMMMVKTEATPTGGCGAHTIYLANLPTTRKKFKFLGDWISDLMFKPDVSMISGQEKENVEEQR